jgi:hypothetical protein
MSIFPCSICMNELLQRYLFDSSYQWRMLVALKASHSVSSSAGCRNQFYNLSLCQAIYSVLYQYMYYWLHVAASSSLDQWYSTGGTRRHLKGYVDYTICITCIMYQQLWGYKVEEKLYLGVREQKRLNTTGLDVLHVILSLWLSLCLSVCLSQSLGVTKICTYFSLLTLVLFSPLH